MKIIRNIVITLLMMYTTSSIKAQPNWVVSNASEYQYSMTVVCKINIDGNVSADPNDIIAAFCDGECRAEGKPDAEGMVYLTVLSNLATGDFVTLKVWSSKDNKEYILSQTLAFEEGATYGDMLTPVTFHTNIKNYRLKAFNMFSPNGDDINDKWAVEDLSLVTDLQLIIFSTNGNEVYKHSVKGYDNSWEGKDKNGNKLPTGTYVYQFLDKDKKAIFRGSITIVR